MRRLLSSRARCLLTEDRGFTMIEILASIIVIAIVTSASAAFFINNIRGVNGQKQRQEAVYLADQQLQKVQSLPVGNLVSGRTQASVNTLLASAAATRLKISSQDDTTNSGNYDATATGSSTPAVPTTLTQAVNRVSYALSTFIDVCWYDNGTGLCGTTQASDGSRTKEYRASVDIYWTSSSPCTNGCSYSTSTIIDPSSDPLFNTNISAPTGSIVTPSNATVYNDGPATPFVVTGTNLKSGIRVLISSGGGTIANVTQPSAGEVDFTLAGGDKPGSYTLTVINTDGGHFQTTVNEIPQISDASGWTVAGKTLTLTGGGFESGATLGATAGSSWTTFTRNSYTSATVSGFTGPTNGANSTLTVTNPDSTTATYKVTAPKETVVSPSSVTVGQATAVTVTGTGFQPGTMVTATNGTATISYSSASSVTVTVTPTSTGTDSITVYNDDGGSSNTFSVTVTAAVVNPTISSITTTIPRNTTSTMTINGTGFKSGATVILNVSGFGTYPVSAVTVVSSTKITFSINSSGAPSGNYTVTYTVTNTDGGTVSKTQTLTVS